MKKVMVLILIIAVAMVFCSCGVETCGDGKYKCLDMISTLPYQSPVKYIDYQDIFLFANGDLVQKESYNSQRRVVNLKVLCDCDTICDLADQRLYPIAKQNYGKPVSTYDDIYMVVLSPTKAIGISNFEIVERVFGNSGPDSTRLQDARYCAINSSNETFIADYGDSSIKVYDYDGNFINKWRFVGEPFQLKCRGQSLYYYDKSDNRIHIFDKNGQDLGQISISEPLEDVTAFTLIYDNWTSEGGNQYWVADRNGTRLTGFDGRGKEFETKTDYCYQDVSLNFGKVIGLSGFYGGLAVSVYIADGANSMIIDLGFRRLTD